jgi:hypothetical protein
MPDLRQLILDEAHGPATKLVAAFFDPARPFAGATFDTLPDNPPNTFTASDLVAVSLLDVRFEPRAVRQALTFNPVAPAQGSCGSARSGRRITRLK